MKELYGKKLRVSVAGLGALGGRLVGERDGCLLLAGKSGRITRIPKGQVQSFSPVEADPEGEYFPMLVFGCCDSKRGCSGVRCVKVAPIGYVPKASDYGVFMEPCPCREETCVPRKAVELADLPRAELVSMLNRMVFGTYPASLPEAAPAENEVEGTNGEPDGTDPEAGDAEEET